MVWWILGGIALLLCLILWIRLGVFFTFGEKQLTADLTIGSFRVRLSPGKESKIKTVKKPKKEAVTADGQTAGKMHLSKSLLATIKSAITTLAPAVKQALHRTRRSIKIQPLSLSFIIGGSENAAEAARYYGYAQAAMWTVMPPLEELLVIPDPRIHIGLDFAAAQTRAEGEAGFSIRIGTLLSLGFSLGIPTLKWFIGYRKELKKQPPAQKTTDTAVA